MRIIQKGTTLVCINCREGIYELRYDVSSNEIVRSLLLKGVNGIQDPSPSSSIECPLCKYSGWDIWTTYFLRNPMNVATTGP